MALNTSPANLPIQFSTLFNGQTPEAQYFCPGRVNLIGEHIDYNGGLVMPAAISLGITASISRNGTATMRIFSTLADNAAHIAIAAIEPRPGHWSDYIIGIMMRLQKDGVVLQGCDIHISSTLPQGSGLSSSAALEVLFYYMLTHFLAGTEPDRLSMAVACQQVENGHIGVQCGIMDQFAVAMGQEDRALLLDCNTLQHKAVPLHLNGHELIIIDSRAPRSLAASAYNQRRSECEEALRLLQVDRELTYLIDATLAEVDTLNDATLRKRARHVVTENMRVKAASHALQTNDLIAFGQLLNASHASLRGDYEVSSAQLDHIVMEAQTHDGCLGARLTGAGFGGCCIALMKPEGKVSFQHKLKASYTKQFNLSLGFHACKISAGVHALTI